jgi:hypothetical protein
MNSIKLCQIYKTVYTCPLRHVSTSVSIYLQIQFKQRPTILLPFVLAEQEQISVAEHLSPS